MNWALLLPGYLVTGLAFGVFTLDLVMPRLSRALLAYLGALLLVAVGVVVWVTHPEAAQSFAGGILIFDDYSRFFFVLFIAIGAVTVLGSAQYIHRVESPGEYFALLIMSVVGAMGMAAAGELVTAYISLELLSGFQVGPGASVVRAALAMLSASFGGVIYHLLRAPVRFLLGRDQ